MKALFIGLSALVAISAFADIKLRKGDTFSIKVINPINIKIGESHADSPNGCGHITLHTVIERFDRVIKAGTVYNFVIRNYEDPYPVDYYSDFSYLIADNSSSESVVKHIELTSELPRFGTLSALKSVLLGDAKGCLDFEFVDFQPAGHEESVEVE